MADIARLGISVPTGDLREGKAALEALVPAAKKAEQAAQRFNDAAAGLAGLPGKIKPAQNGMEQIARAAQGVVGTTNGVSKAALGAGTHLGSLGAAAAGASFQMNALGQASARVAAQTAMADAHIKAYRDSLSKVAPAAQQAGSSLQRLGAAANDNINRLQSTPGNIAAQFQDIGVTAAGGMSPLLIALQQGTQLSSAMQGGIGNLLAGFRQLFNMTTVLTIGLVGLVAAGLQMVNWMKLAETLVVGLAEFVAEYSDVLLYAGTVALIAFGPAILSSIVAMATAIGMSLVTAVSTATMAMISFSLANPFGALLVAIGVVIGAMIALNDAFGGVFTGILKVVKTVANAIIKFFMTAFNSVVTAAETFINGLIAGFNTVAGFLGFDEVGTITLSGIKFDLSRQDVIGDIASGVSDLASRGVNAAKGLFAPKAAPKATTGGSVPAAARGMTDAERETKAYEDLTLRAAARVKELQDEATALGMTQEAARAFRNEQDMLNQAAERGIMLDAERGNELQLLAGAMTNAQIAIKTQEATNAYNEQMLALKQQSELIGLNGRALQEASIYQDLLNDAVQDGIPITAAYTQLLQERAAALAGQTEANRSAEFMADVTRDFEAQTFALQRQRGEFTLTGAALEAYRIESDLLVDAMRRGVELTPQQVEAIRQQAGEYAKLNEQIQRQREWSEIGRDALNSLFGDMYQNLRQGQSVWQAFGNVVMNVVDNIIQMLLRLAAQKAFEALVGGLGRGGGLIDSGGAIPNNSGQGFDATLAKGGAFNTGGVHMFAKGGAFTNGIYNSPTMFKFAKGGAFGLMGEAGPEAVMPLKRGSDGSLGVQVQAMEPQTVLVRVVTDDERFDAYVDGRISEQAPDIAQAGAIIGERESAFKKTRRLA